jgi:hypothetical protein
MTRRVILSMLVLLALLPAAPGKASVTLGQVAPPGFTPATCGPSSGAYVQPTVTSGTSFVAPGAGTLTSWSTRATSASGQMMALRLFRPLGGAVYLNTSHDGPRPLAPSVVNTFTVNLPIKAGDILGVDTSGTGNLVGCAFQVPGETRWGSFPEAVEDGESATFSDSANYRLNVSAVMNPSNAFTFGRAIRNRKNGTATITVELPGPGAVSLRGKGVKGQTAQAGTPGPLKLRVAAKGKLKKRLQTRGKVRAKASVTFTPTGGDAADQPVGLKLIRR